MDSILGVVGGVTTGTIKVNNDDDSVDKLSHRYTTIMLIICAVIVSTKQYVGEPINCWVPAHFTGNWESYANSYCWVKNTYYLPFEDYIPKQHEDEKRDMIPYYQWVPLILLSQALMFYFPRLVWRSINNKTAVDVDNIVLQAETFQKAEMADNKAEKMGHMVDQMDRFLRSRDFYSGGCTLSLTACMSKVCCPVCGRRTGNYLSLAYLAIKCLFIVNVIGQLFIMDKFLDTDYHFYGIDVISSIANGTDWRDSPRFPRVTMCDFHVRRLGNLQRYTVQCVLPINLFNEMIYLFIWFWMVFVAFMTCLGLLSWSLHLLLGRDRKRYVQKHLDLLDRLKDKSHEEMHENHFVFQPRELLTQFVEDYLRTDGVFISRLVGANTDAVTVTEFICAMFDKYYEMQNELENGTGPPPPIDSK